MKKGEQRQQFQFFYKKITKALPSLYENNLVIGISNEDYLARGESVIINRGILFIHAIWIRQDTNRKKM